MLPAGVATLDVDLRVLDANEGLADLLGRPAGELVGRFLDDLLAPASRVMLHNYLLPLLQLHGRVEEFAATLDAADGQRPDVLLYARWAEPALDDPVVSGRPPPGAAAVHPGRSLHVVVVRHRARRQVEDDLLRIKRAADQSPGVMFQLQQMADGSVLLPYASEALRSHFRVSPQEARRDGRRVMRRVHPQDRRMLAARVAAAEPAATAEIHEQIRVRAGPRRWRIHEIQASGRRTGEGRWVWHGHSMDITARLELESTLRERDAADEARRRQLEFLTRLSHELRTPLNAILGFTQLLDRQVDPPLAPEHRVPVSVIGEAGRHLLQLIDDVLEISRRRTTDFSVRMQPVDLQAVMLAAMRGAHASAEAGGITLHLKRTVTCESPGQLACVEIPCPPAVQADGLRLRQVLDNLIGNAIKFNRPGGRVELSVACGPSSISFTVADDGPGIALERQQQLFQPFNRLGAEHSQVPGSVLGLVISQQLVEAMQGRLEVQSARGQGSRFTVHLQRAAEEAAVERSEDGHPGGMTIGGMSADILYVEDDRVNAMLMGELLQLHTDVHLRIAVSAEAALKAVREHPPQLLLLDRHLPDGDGLALRQELLALPGMTGVPTIMVSAAATAHDIALARDAGFDGYWTKPLDIPTVLSDLERRLRKGPDPKPAND